MSQRLQHLLRSSRPAGAGEVPDRELVDRFLLTGDEAAFELLVWRHGPMVLSVCARLLQDGHDIEDAFQATFLTLVRKASSLGKREAVGSWLHKVAYRVALRARARAARRAAHEKPMGALSAEEAAYEPADEPAWRELCAILDAEVNRLPEKYRTPVVLCYLEGKTNEEAAEQLGCPKGTILSRLARARARLRERLRRRGLTLSAWPLGQLVSHGVSLATVPAALVSATLRLALPAGPGKKREGLVSPSVNELTEGVLREMRLSRLKLVATLLLVLAVLGTAAGAFAYGTLASESPAHEMPAGTTHNGPDSANQPGGCLNH